MDTVGFKNIAVSLVLALFVGWAWRVLNWVWVTPRKMEKYLRKQGIQGNSYRFLYGDSKENSEMVKSALSKPISLSDDAVPRASPFIHHTVVKYGKNSFMWFGPAPRLLITDPELIKEVMNKNNIFKKLKQNPIVRMFSHGLASIDGDQWVQHKKLLAPAFHLHKLKVRTVIGEGECFKNRLLTRDKMVRFEMNVNAGCSFCYGLETPEHLFSTCPYTYSILSACPIAIKADWADLIYGQ